MLSRMKKTSELIIEEILDFCLNKNIKDCYALSILDKEKYGDLLIAFSENYGSEFYMEINHISFDLMRLKFKCGNKNDVIENLCKNYIDSLDAIPQLISKINNIIELSWQNYYYENPKRIPENNFLILIDDDNKDRLRSLRNI